MATTPAIIIAAVAVTRKTLTKNLNATEPTGQLGTISTSSLEDGPTCPKPSFRLTTDATAVALITNETAAAVNPRQPRPRHSLEHSSNVRITGHFKPNQHRWHGALDRHQHHSKWLVNTHNPIAPLLHLVARPVS